MNGKPSDSGRASAAGGFLSRLARDTRGNTLAMMAAFTIPLAALAGSAVDMSRAYLVKVRLQQACDAGVLAGRKVMTVNSGTLLDATAYNPANTSATPAHTAAKAFFDNNFPAGWMGTTGTPTFTPSRMSDGQVTATASATLPMAIMGMFGFGATTQTVTCTARLDIGDSDIMFVLDTTGSMACYTGTACTSTSTWTQADGSTGYYETEQPDTGSGATAKTSKINAVRNAVKLFRTTLESNKPTEAHIRYGFVAYSSSVNVGAVIRARETADSAQYLANTVTYPSRELATNASGTSLTAAKLNEDPKTNTGQAYYIAAGNFNQGDVNYNTGTAPTAQNAAPTTRTNCFALETRRFSTTGTTQQDPGKWPTSGTVTRVFPIWNSSTNKCTTITWTVKPLWRFGQIARDVSSFKVIGTSINDPTKLTTPATKWQGCITMATTQSTTSSTYSSSSLPDDMNPDFVPTTEANRWRPMWPETIYYRQGTGAEYYYGGNTNTASSDATSTSAGANYSTLLASLTGSLGPNAQYYGCGAPAKTLAEMSATDFNSYLGSATSGDFRPFGHTYHDVGMIWGLRLISPDGPWAPTTAAWAGHNPPNRYIVFMTDGDILPDPDAYHLYGLNSAEAGAAAANTTVANLSTIHTNRFLAACNAAKSKGITVFVVQFDNGSTPSDDMTDCASAGYAYAAQTQSQLQSAFSTIALEITRLRLSQ